MTSVFSQVAGERQPFELRRISFSAQEWCGQVFDEAPVPQRADQRGASAAILPAKAGGPIS